MNRKGPSTDTCGTPYFSKKKIIDSPSPLRPYDIAMYIMITNMLSVAGLETDGGTIFSFTGCLI